MYLLRVPLFIIALIICNVIAINSPNILDRSTESYAFSMGMISGDMLKVYWADLLLLLGVIILYVELFKSTRSNVSSIIEHVLSMVVFIIFLIEFLVVKRFGNTTFFLLTMFSLLDVVGGFTISISTARRDIDRPMDIMH